jgi:hypothetical protein
MISRCYYPKNISYHRYGARGVTVCDRWRKSFDDFLADMGRAPSQAHSLDRINNDLGYEPGNVRWATDHEQNRNREGNRWLEYQGVRLCAADWAKRIGVAKATILERLGRGWSIERTLTTSGHKRNRQPTTHLLLETTHPEPLFAGSAGG